LINYEYLLGVAKRARPAGRPVWPAIFGGLSRSFELAFYSWLGSSRWKTERAQGRALNSFINFFFCL